MKKPLQRSVVFTGPQMDFLQKESRRLGISMADLVRRIIDRFIEQNDRV